MDTLIAVGGMACGVAALGALEHATGLPLYDRSMMSSGIIFFYAAKPPALDAFLWGTGICSTVGIGITTVCSQTGWPLVMSHGVATMALLAFWRHAGAVFPPVAALPGVLATVAGPDAASLSASLYFLVFPWLTGHAVLYAAAVATAALRRSVRDRQTAAAITQFGSLSDYHLREVFDSFDTSGDGMLDASELQVAMRTLGHTLTFEEAEALLGQVDADCSGTIEFEEFAEACRRMP